MADETQVIAPVEAPAPPAAPAEPVTPPPAPETPATPPAESGPGTLTDLEEAMKAGLPADDPAAPVDPAAQPTPAPEFQQMLSISEFVKTPEHVQAAIRAADEVWKVSSGQMPASQMLEAMRQANPQGYQNVFNDLAAYVEKVSGKKLGGEPAATDDPIQKRLNELEAGVRQQETERQQGIYQQQMSRARGVATEAITKLTKGTAFEGDEGYLLQQCASKTNISEKDMVDMLNRGFTKPLETALKAVQKEETARLKRYNDNLIKNYRTLKNAVPAPASGGPQGTPAAGTMAYKPGETAAQFATRVWNQKLV